MLTQKYCLVSVLFVQPSMPVSLLLKSQYFSRMDILTVHSSKRLENLPWILAYFCYSLSSCWVDSVQCIRIMIYSWDIFHPSGRLSLYFLFNIL
jgi:hypothetical protein